MDEWPQLHEGMSCSGLTVAVDASLRVATLRYFAREGAFAEAVREATGLALPQTMQAVERREAHLVLAWRSPTETLVIALAPRASRSLRRGSRASPRAASWI